MLNHEALPAWPNRFTTKVRMSELNHHAHQKTSFAATLGAIAWSFIGLRRRKDYERDVTGLNPIYVLVAALIGVGAFIAALIMVAKLAVS